MLEFSESKPATSPEAIEDIKIHAANLYGFGGVSFEERISWIDANMELIRRSVADPLGQEFWQHADESSPGAKDGTPWQFLAACRALVDPDAASRLPVRRDGSCNGLQHYAALGRDPSAAFSVNLTPSDRPNSVYLDVAAVLKGMIEHDAKTGTKVVTYRKRTKDGATEPKSITIAAIAEMTLPFINKKTVKQPVMTSVYDVTRVGATAQIMGKLEKQGLTDEAIHAAARHLAERTEQALATICSSAAKIMEWLRDCGKRIASKDRLVTWTTPIGFPVVQPYRKMQFVRVTTLAGRVRIPTPVFSTAPINKLRHIRGIAPNFVHSLDATHMFMVASACHADGIAFAAVHDGYLTHAATCRDMVKHTLEQFVKLHSRPVLDDLVAELRAKHPDIEFKDPPARGEFDINDVLGSKYLFS
jgi:DNA-directed RNA polymerase